MILFKIEKRVLGQRKYQKSDSHYPAPFIAPILE